MGIYIVRINNGTESIYHKSSVNVLTQHQSFRQRFAFGLLVVAMVVTVLPLPIIAELNVSILRTDCIFRHHRRLYNLRAADLFRVYMVSNIGIESEV